MCVSGTRCLFSAMLGLHYRSNVITLKVELEIFRVEFLLGNVAPRLVYESVTPDNSRVYHRIFSPCTYRHVPHVHINTRSRPHVCYYKVRVERECDNGEKNAAVTPPVSAFPVPALLCRAASSSQPLSKQPTRCQRVSARDIVIMMHSLFLLQKACYR